MGIGYNVAVCVYDDSRAHRVLPYDQRGLRTVFLVRGAVTGHKNLHRTRRNLSGQAL